MMSPKAMRRPSRPMAQRKSFLTAKVIPGSKRGVLATECSAMPMMRAITISGSASRPPVAALRIGAAR